MKHETAGKKASSLKTIQFTTEKIIEREKNRTDSRKGQSRKESSMNCSVGTTTPTQGVEALWRPQ